MFIQRFFFRLASRKIFLPHKSHFPIFRGRRFSEILSLHQFCRENPSISGQSSEKCLHFRCFTGRESSNRPQFPRCINIHAVFLPPESSFSGIWYRTQNPAPPLHHHHSLGSPPVPSSTASAHSFSSMHSAALASSAPGITISLIFHLLPESSTITASP